MAKTLIEWDWRDAFDKFGFGDGDSWNGTGYVREFLEGLGWTLNEAQYGAHNWMIFKMTKGDVVIEADGYKQPEEFLPQELIDALDKKFGNAMFNEDGEISLWDRNDVQFARLVAELQGLGVFDQQTMLDLEKEMDLSNEELCELVARACTEFEAVKKDLFGGKK